MCHFYGDAKLKLQLSLEIECKLFHLTNVLWVLYPNNTFKRTFSEFKYFCFVNFYSFYLCMYKIMQLWCAVEHRNYWVLGCKGSFLNLTINRKILFKKSQWRWRLIFSHSGHILKISFGTHSFWPLSLHLSHKFLIQVVVLR